MRRNSVHEANEEIREVAGRFLDGFDDPEFDFLCECGCLTRVALSVSSFDAVSGPVLAAGHTSNQARSK